MKESLRLFNTRKGEVEIYFSFLETITEKGVKIQLRDGDHKDINNDTLHILRANGFILLYNLIESCISQAIEDIYIDVINNEFDYDALKVEIQTELLKHIKTQDATKVANEITEISFDIIKNYPPKNKLFSGNVDAEKVREIAKKYGFSIRTDARRTNNGANLLTIKNQRNDLAHGFISFKDCGQACQKDVIKIKDASLLYVEQILNNIATFIDEKKYLKENAVH